MRSVNIDLIYGCRAVAGRLLGADPRHRHRIHPDRLAVYSYAHLPQLFAAADRRNPLLLDGGAKLALLQLAVRKLTAAGYVYIGMDHFALPGDELAIAQSRGGLHCNFMGYTTHADSDLIGLGRP